MRNLFRLGGTSFLITAENRSSFQHMTDCKRLLYLNVALHRQTRALQRHLQAIARNCSIVQNLVNRQF